MRKPKDAEEPDERLGDLVKPKPVEEKRDHDGRTWTKLKPGIWINDLGQLATRPKYD